MLPEMLVIAREKWTPARQPRKMSWALEWLARSVLLLLLQQPRYFPCQTPKGVLPSSLLCCRACKGSSCCWIWNAFLAIPAFPKAQCSKCRREWQLGQALAACRKRFVTED